MVSLKEREVEWSSPRMAGEAAPSAAGTRCSDGFYGVELKGWSVE